jgi:hypothetical protein
MSSGQKPHTVGLEECIIIEKARSLHAQGPRFFYD